MAVETALEIKIPNPRRRQRSPRRLQDILGGCDGASEAPDPERLTAGCAEAVGGGVERNAEDTSCAQGAFGNCHSDVGRDNDTM